MRSRLELHTVLTQICKNVYFQPPESVKLKYPCIIYEKVDEDQLYADNIKYRGYNVYDLTIITKDPDSEIPDCIGKLDYCSYSRSFVSENLIHHVYRLYF